jgi:hypothetical protein
MTDAIDAVFSVARIRTLVRDIWPDICLYFEVPPGDKTPRLTIRDCTNRTVLRTAISPLKGLFRLHGDDLGDLSATSSFAVGVWFATYGGGQHVVSNLRTVPALAFNLEEDNGEAIFPLRML